MGWLALAVCVLLAVVGPLLDLPDAVMDVSPFTDSPSLPGGSLDVGALVGMTAIAAALVTGGLGAFGRRDVSSGA